jgi:hypothetical protein
MDGPVRTESLVGVGELRHRGGVVAQVRYALTAHQGLAGNGMPVPGRFRIEGTVDAGMTASFADLVGAPLDLTLVDGRVLAVSLADATGRVRSEGHGPSRCLCC